MPFNVVCVGSSHNNYLMSAIEFYKLQGITDTLVFRQ